MRPETARRLSIAGFALASGLFLGAEWAAVRQMTELREAAGQVKHSLIVREEAEGVLSLLKDAETGQRGFVITGAAQYLHPYEAALAALPPQVDRLRRLTADNARQQASLARLDGLIQRKVDGLRATITARQHEGLEAAARRVEIGAGKRTMDEIRVVVAAIGAEEDRILAEREATEERHARLTFAWSLGGLAAAIGLLGAALLLMGRAIGQRERERMGRATAEAVAAAVGQSEERLRVTIASIGDAVIATDERGRVSRLNAVAEALTGWTEAEAAGRPLEDVFFIINEESRQAAENPVQRVLRDGVTAGRANHTLLVSKDGREIAIDDSAAPIRTVDGRLAGAVMVFRDISERRRAERERAALLENERAARIGAETAEEQLRLALEAGHMGTWQYVIRTGEVKWSSGLETIHGYSPGGFPGTFEAFRNEIHPDDRERVLGAIGAAVEQRRDHHVEYRIVRVDGTVRWVEGRGQLFCDPEGLPERMVGVCLDVTDRKREEETFRLAVEAAPAAMFMVDPRGTILLVNALTEQLLGYARDELIGQSIDRLVPSRFRGGHPEHRTSFFRESRQRPMGAGRDLYALRKDGSEVPVEIGLSPLDTADGRFVLAAVTDITERKRTEKSLQESDRRKDEFLAMLAHELRNPLGAITNAAQLLKQLGPPEGNMRWAREVIDRQAGHLARIVDDLLDVSRISRGQITLRRERVPLAAAVAVALETARPLMEARRLQFTSAVAPDSIWVDGDTTRLAQVIGNLLSNAARYTGQGGAVVLTVRREAAEAVVRIKDTGIGIAPDMLPRIFELFVQAERSLDRAPGGLGLGLTLARRLTEMHGGRLDAFSEGLGKGSEFVVRLPILAGERPAAVGARPVLVYEAVRRRILVVDDNADSAESLALALGMTGHEVRLAGDGPSALAAAAEFRPEVALLDIGLPGMNGYDLARRLRTQSGSEGIVLVALTGYGQEEDRRRAREAGFDHHLVKPISPEAILAVLGSRLPSFGSSRPSGPHDRT